MCRHLLQDGKLYPHFFYTSYEEERAYHGRPIDPATRFHRAFPLSDAELPDPRLLRWHYKQCVQARLRGYAWDMGINAQGGAAAS
jgi:hypothetical protein